jgi:hypothetical protein
VSNNLGLAVGDYQFSFRVRGLSEDEMTDLADALLEFVVTRRPEIAHVVTTRLEENAA